MRNTATTGRPITVRALAEAAIFADFMLVLMFIQRILPGYSVIMPMFAPVVVAVMVRRNRVRTAWITVFASIILTMIFISPLGSISVAFYCLTGLMLGSAAPDARSQTLAILGAWVINFVASFVSLLVGVVLAGQNVLDVKKYLLDSWILGRLFGGQFIIYAFLIFQGGLSLALAFGARWLTRKLLARM